MIIVKIIRLKNDPTDKTQTQHNAKREKRVPRVLLITDPVNITKGRVIMLYHLCVLFII